MPTVLVHFLLLSLLFLCLIHNANTTFYLNTKYITMHCNTVVAKIVRTQFFHQLKLVLSQLFVSFAVVCQ